MSATAQEPWGWRWRRGKRGVIYWSSEFTGRVYGVARVRGRRWALAVDGIQLPVVYDTCDEAAVAALAEDIVCEAEMIAGDAL